MFGGFSTPQGENPIVALTTGGRWTAIGTPTSPARPGGIEGTSTDDIWIVGDDDASSGFVPAAAHWDGTRWSDVLAGQKIGGREGLFSTVLTLPDGATWAAGYAGVGASAIPYLTEIHTATS